MLVQRCSFATLASIRKEQGRDRPVALAWRLPYKWPSLESSLSRPVLPLLGCRPLMLVHVAPEGWRMRRASRTRCTCPQAPLLVLEVRGWYLGSRRCSDDGDDGNLVALGSAWGMGHRSGLTSFRGESRAGFGGLEHTCPLSRSRGDAPDASWLPYAARTGGGRSGFFRGVKTVLLRRREKRGESGCGFPRTSSPCPTLGATT